MSIVVALVVIAIVAIVILIGIASYLKAPPNMAYVVSGLRKEPKYIIGTNGFRVPFLERLDKLYLGVIGIDVKTREPVPTAEYINVFVDANVNVKISDNHDLMARAAKNFLNQKTDAIALKAQQVLEGNVREIIGQMKLTDLVSDRQAFAEKVMENVGPDMNKLGLEVVSFNVQNFSDENGVINDLGIDNVEQIKKNALIAKSDAKREVAMREAENQRQANEAQVAAATQIAEQNNALDIRTAELKSQSEVKRAAADMAYDIQKADQKKELDVAETNARIAQAEREVELQTQKIALKEKELDALVRKEADAKLYATQKAAEADLIKRQKEAEAKAYEEVQKAEAEQRAAVARAEAMKAEAEARMFAAEKEAAGIAAKYAAEAEGIRAKGLAEAEGIDKKAEAQKKMGEASVLEMYFNAMPLIAEAVAMPLANVDSITMYGEGNQAKMVQDITTTMNQIMSGIKDATGIDPSTMLSSFAGSKLAQG
jgi:flotillin